jgi:hypothetical protein
MASTVTTTPANPTTRELIGKAPAEAGDGLLKTFACMSSLVLFELAGEGRSPPPFARAFYRERRIRRDVRAKKWIPGQRDASVNRNFR